MNTSVSVLSRVSCSVLQQYSRNVPAVAAACTVPSSGNRIPAGRSFGSGNRTSTSYFFKVNGQRRWPAVQAVSSRDYTQAASTLTREQLHDLVYRLNEDERELLMNTLKQFESNKQKAQFEAEAEPTPSTRDLMKLGLVNALPFIGFGFLDNFTMIIAGDYIEHTLGLFMCISTMAAAALGNTISDVIGIGSAFYVEKLAEMSGVRPPKMTPIQLEMKASRRAANMGRVWGITIGCLLGMCPLLFMKDEDKDGDKKKADKKDNGEAASSQNTPEVLVLEGSK
uniref:Putative conserved plasma membrane protein n=1 Tax=Culex tarsalis TaxID=7177 RepID=A0A1Q3G223_CULTA